jgi:hypothetical protein
MDVVISSELRAAEAARMRQDRIGSESLPLAVGYDSRGDTNLAVNRKVV